MADSKEKVVFNFTTPITLSYENLFKPRQFGKGEKASGTPKFDANFEIGPDSPDLPALKAAAVKVARAKWPDRDLKTEFKFPWTLGDKLADRAKLKGKDREFSRGKVVLVARSQFEPVLSIAENGKIIEYEGERRILAKPFFYPGVQVLVEISFEAYEGIGANPDGVTAYLNKVFSTRKGQKIEALTAQRSSSADVFKGYAGVLSTEDPTQGSSNLDDDIPF